MRPAGLRYSHDVSADGQRFLVNTMLEQEQIRSAPITVALNWTAELKKK